jgi:hypothetical protein
MYGTSNVKHVLHCVLFCEMIITGPQQIHSSHFWPVCIDSYITLTCKVVYIMLVDLVTFCEHETNIITYKQNQCQVSCQH